MTTAELSELVESIRKRGPDRVVINSDGEAVSPTRARRDYDIVSDVIYIRNDGWSLGATSAMEPAARKMWLNEWVAILTREGIVEL